jgi:NAD(P)-dependent dehydrogenase (short-subunit alcohol dehydrogenase family)
MQFGTNHLGHFTLTGLKLDLMIGTAGAQVITTSSGAHRMGYMRLDDLRGEHGY